MRSGADDRSLDVFEVVCPDGRLRYRPWVATDAGARHRAAMCERGCNALRGPGDPEAWREPPCPEGTHVVRHTRAPLADPFQRPPPPPWERGHGRLVLTQELPGGNPSLDILGSFRGSGLAPPWFPGRR